MLQVSQISKRYGATHAVRDLSFFVPAGTVVSLIGPNGAGKSTTIGMLTGILPASSGTVTLDGDRVAADQLRALARIGYIPDRPDIYEHLSAREYIRFVAGLYGIPEVEADRRAAPLLARFRLAGQEGTALGAYSFGMRQKVVIIATLVHEPALLVLDEPIVGLDPVSAKILRDIMAERAAAGAIVLFSTHLLSVAADVADRFLVIAGGTLRAHGTLADLRTQAGFPDDANVDLEEVFFRLIGETYTGPTVGAASRTPRAAAVGG
jgi:ABC-2 type transport system ATP-binding protein